MFSGVLAAAVRPSKGEKGLRRIINAGTVRAVVFVFVGVLAVLVGLGVVPVLNWPGDSDRNTPRTPG
jgi:hypothetical protein